MTADLPNIDEGLRTLDADEFPYGAGDLQTLPIEPAAEKANRRYNRNVQRRRFVTLQQHQAAVEHLDPLPRPGESLHGVMSGSYSAWSLATAIIELIDSPVSELTISTLGFNRANLAGLVELLDSGQVERVLLNVSHYFRHSDRDIFDDIRNALEKRGQRVAVTRCHAKLLLFDAGQRQIVLETSANLRSSMNYEQFTISDDAELLAFHRRWIVDLIGNDPCEQTQD